MLSALPRTRASARENEVNTEGRSERERKRYAVLTHGIRKMERRALEQRKDPRALFLLGQMKALSHPGLTVLLSEETGHRSLRELRACIPSWLSQILCCIFLRKIAITKFTSKRFTTKDNAKPW